MFAADNKPSSSYRPNKTQDKPAFLSIRFYLIVVNIILICLLFPVLSLLFWQKTSQLQKDELASRIHTMETSLEARGKSLLSSMSLSANQAITSFDYTFINQLIQQVANSDNELQYCLLTDLRGIIVAHSNPALVGSHVRLNEFDVQAQSLLENSFSKFLAEGAKPEIKVLYLRDGPGRNIRHEMISPVYNGSQLWGGLRCGYSFDVLQDLIKATESKWQNERDQFTLFIFEIGIPFFGIALLVAILFSKRIIHAISQLNYGVKAVTDGDLDRRIPPKGLLCSEFYKLSTMINNMTENLQDSRQKLNNYSESLEKLVDKRTSELEAVNAELESFSYSVSHDLRAPLRSIDGFSQMIIEDYKQSLDETGVYYLSRVRKASQNMGILIDSLLKFSRLNREPIKRQQVDLSKMAKEIFTELKELQPERNVEVDIADNLQANVDSNLIKVVLTNLLGNAWKYTSKQQQAVVTMGKRALDGEMVFFIKDNGIGFNMNYADKLFGAFQRLHKADEFDGTGIGLATVHRIIQRHGGRIWAEAKLNQGATFYFHLPSNSTA